MTNCTRFEDEGLLILEQGGELDAHFSSCETCLEEQRKYAVLKQLISVDDASEPQPGWELEVLESLRALSVDQPGANQQSAASPNKSGQASWYAAIAASIAVIAVASLLVLQFSGEFSGSPVRNTALEVTLISGDTVYRGDDAKVGDKIELAAPRSETGFSIVRVYRDERLHYSCGAIEPCKVSNGSIVTTVELSALGDYQSVLIQSDKAIALTSNRLDQDILSARDNGATVTLSKLISVR